MVRALALTISVENDAKRASPEMRALPIHVGSTWQASGIVALHEVAEPKPGKRGLYGKLGLVSAGLRIVTNLSSALSAASCVGHHLILHVYPTHCRHLANCAGGPLLQRDKYL